MAATVPNCRAYDPAFSYEVAVILDHGMRTMLEDGRDEFYYLTVMNENYAQPSMPEGIQANIIKGLYCFTRSPAKEGTPSVRLVGSGAILPEVIEAGKMLERDWGSSSSLTLPEFLPSRGDAARSAG
jgi:pyruvate dehydrogenase E1 component